MLTAAPVIIYVIRLDYRKSKQIYETGNVNSFYNLTLNSTANQFRFKHFFR
jgi:hypothetical protein